MAGNNIASLRKRAGISQTELANRIGTSLNMLGKLERGDRTLNANWIEKIAAALGVDPGDVITAREMLTLVNNSAAGRVPRPDVPPTRNSSEGETASVMRMDLSYAMGPGTNLDNSYVEAEPVIFDLGFLRSLTPSPPSALRIVSGVGDSMFPTIHDREDLIIDTNQRVLNMHDRIWAISLFGAGALKRLRAISRDRLLVISDNPDVPDQEVGVDDVTIVARLVGSIRRH